MHKILQVFFYDLTGSFGVTIAEISGKTAKSQTDFSGLARIFSRLFALGRCLRLIAYRAICNRPDKTVCIFRADIRRD